MQRRMKNRRSRCRSQQQQRSPPPPLQAAQRGEMHEDEADLENAKLLMGFFNAVWDEHDAKRNSRAPSTKAGKLPQVDTEKEVAVRPVNPHLGNQAGKERMMSIANAVEGAGTEKLTLTGRAIGERLVASDQHQHTVLIGSRIEPDSVELPPSIQPSSAPEGSLLHAMYLQLLGAGRDGISMRDLLTCLKEPAQVLNFGSNWKVQVRKHLESNPHFRGAKGLYQYVDQFQVLKPPRKSSPAHIANTSRHYEASSSQAVLPGLHSTPTEHTGLSMDTQEGVDRARRKAFMKASAALFEQAKEFEDEMHQSVANMPILPSSAAHPTNSYGLSRKQRISFSSHDEKLSHPIAGGLHGTHGEILAETDQRCLVVKEDDTGNWQCINMAMAGHAHCEYHMNVKFEEDGEASLSANPNPGSPLIAPERECSHLYKSNDGTRSLKCSNIAVEGHNRCEHHKEKKERKKQRKKAHRRADAQQGMGDAVSLQHNEGSGNHDERANGERLQLQMPENGPESHRVAAGKTAANEGPLKFRVRVRTPGLPPLPPRRTVAMELEETLQLVIMKNDDCAISDELNRLR